MERSKRGGRLVGQSPVHFLPTVTATIRTQREIELSRASARSHLAKEIHRRRNGKGGQRRNVHSSRGQQGTAIKSTGNGTKSIIVLPRRAANASTDEPITRNTSDEARTVVRTSIDQSQLSVKFVLGARSFLKALSGLTSLL